MKIPQSSSTTLKRAWWGLPLIAGSCSWGWAMMYASQLAWMLTAIFFFLSFALFLVQVLVKPSLP